MPSESFVPSCSKCFPPGKGVCGNAFSTPFDAEVGCGSCSKKSACAGASGIIGEMSCIGEQACYQFGYIASLETTNGEGSQPFPFTRSLQELIAPIIPKDEDGEIQPPRKVEGSSIGESSCRGDFACSGASGMIGSSSCIGINACSFVPFKVSDGGEGEVSKFFTSVPKLAQGDFTNQKGSILSHNEQVLEGEKYLAKSILPFTRSLQEIQQPSIVVNLVWEVLRVNKIEALSVTCLVQKMMHVHSIQSGLAMAAGESISSIFLNNTNYHSLINILLHLAIILVMRKDHV